MAYQFQLYVADTETTGLDYLNNEIVELSIYHINQDRQKTWHLKALKPDSIQLDALRVNGHKIDDILHKTADGRALYKEPKDVVVDVENWFMEDTDTAENRILIGQNIIFDEQFLQKLWKDNGAEDNYPFGKRPFCLDTRQIELFLNLVEGNRNEFYNLNTLIKRYGVKNSKAHSAEADTRATKELVLAQINHIQKRLKE